MSKVCVLGIDPGSQTTGWGVVQECSGALSLIECGAIRAKGADFNQRLAYIHHALNKIVERLAPQEAAIEQVFTAQNPATALKLGQARGIAVGVCAAHGLSVHDYAPTMVKKALVGTGRAEKEQVAFMVGQTLNIKGTWPLDTTDALAIAVCHLTMRRYLQLTSGKAKK